MKRTLAIFLVILMLIPTLPVFAASRAASQDFVREELKGEIIFPVTKTEGTWGKSGTILNYDGKEHLWSGTTGSSATFDISGIKSGNYEVFYYTILHVNNRDNVDLEIIHNNKKNTATIYQKLNEGETVDPGWLSLGVYDFSGNGDEKVKITVIASNHRATGIKLVPSDKPLTVGNEAKDDESESNKPDAVKTTLPVEINVEPAGRCTYVGNWGLSSTVKGPMTSAGFSLWVAGGAGAETYVKYDPEIRAVGDVRISVFLLYWHENQTKDVKYEVFHNGKTEEFHLDPTTIEHSQWVTLGTFDFAGTEDEYVLLSCTGDTNLKGNTRASTVAFEIINSANGDVWQTLYVTPTQTSDALMDAAKVTMAPLDKFDDMKGHWACYDVEYMANEGLIAGKGEASFDPDAQITRAEYLTILDRAMGYELITGETYSDVPQDSWYATYIATAKANGLLNGLPTDDGFKPNSPITREDMALFTYNAIKATGKNDEWLSDLPTDFDKFTDKSEISVYAKEALEYLVHTGIIKGMTETTVSPKGNATRAQGAVMLKRFMQYFVWAGPEADDEWVLTFNDEFLGDGVDYSVWKSDASSPGHILSSRWPENLEVHDGNAYLVNRKEDKGGKQWTSGSMWVLPEVFRQTYGYWEARYKIAAGAGVNNSFWAMTQNNMISSETEKFELDVNEGHYPNEVCTNYHSYATGTNVQHSERYRSEYDLSYDYHTYAMKWTPTEMTYYFDGEVISVKENENAHLPLFPYLSTAILNWGGTPDSKTDGSAQVVDYVRIWQRKDDIEKHTYIGQPVKEVEQAKPVAPSVTVSEQPIDNKIYDGEIILNAVVDEALWGQSPTIPNYDGKSHYWLKKPGAEALFPTKDVKDGKYKVYYWRLPHTVNAATADIYFRANDKDTLVGSAAMRIADGETAECGWVLINENFEIKNAKDANFVYKCTSDGTGRASAVKLVPVK